VNIHSFSISMLLTLLFLATLSLAQVGRPIPPGIHQANQADTQAQQSIPPPAAESRARLDYGKLRSEANELATLAQSVPPEVEQDARGVLPKDLGEKLRQIEKLAKQLRNQLR
jgi:hypothetical protein